jgi:hypothetical protein
MSKKTLLILAVAAVAGYFAWQKFGKKEAAASPAAAG